MLNKEWQEGDSDKEGAGGAKIAKRKENKAVESEISGSFSRGWIGAFGAFFGGDALFPAVGKKNVGNEEEGIGSA